MYVVAVISLVILCMPLMSATCPDNCQSSDCDSEPDKGCPMCAKAYYGRQCQHRMECKHTYDGHEYKGLMNRTNSGRQCQMWSSMEPHAHKYLNEEGNYCRNPDNSAQPWCYTTDKEVRFQYCSIPSCDQQCSAPSIPPGSDISNPALPGVGFTLNYIANILCPDQTFVPSTCIKRVWSDTQCPEITCKPIKDNGMVTLPLKDIYLYGETISVECADGFETNQNSSFSVQTCVSKDQWNGTVPSCQTITCKTLESNNTKILPLQDIYFYGETIVVECADGFETNQYAFISVYTCVSKDQWNGTLISCERITCQSFKSNNSLIQPSKDIYHYGETISVECAIGFRSIDNTSSSFHACVSNDHWNGTVILCERITCQSFKTNNSFKHPSKDIYHYGETISVECAIGYRSLENASFSFHACVSNDYWNGTNILCERVQCPDIPLKGDRHYIVTNKTSYYYQDSVDIGCKGDFPSPFKASKLTCSETASWNGTLPKCLEVISNASGKGKEKSMTTVTYNASDCLKSMATVTSSLLLLTAISLCNL